MHTNPVPISHTVAAEIRGLMAKRQVTQSDLADHLGISQPAVARRLSGRVPLDINELAEIAGFLGVQVTSLLAVEQVAP